MECKKCHSIFKRKVNIDGKIRNLNNRKYCFACSPFGKHNTRKIHLENDQTYSTCKKCNREYPRKRSQSRKLCGSCAVSALRVRRKKEIVDHFGGCCKICGYSKCIAALEFHHLDPEKKEIQISGSTRNKAKLFEEAKKCILVCNRCHRELHSGIVQW